MILSHVFFATDYEIDGVNVILIIQAYRTDKHDDQESWLWRACRKIIGNSK